MRTAPAVSWPRCCGLGEDREAAALDAEAEAFGAYPGAVLVRGHAEVSPASSPWPWTAASAGVEHRLQHGSSALVRRPRQEAPRWAFHLGGPELASGWGLRTSPGAWRGSIQSRTTWARSGPTTPRWPARGYADSGSRAGARLAGDLIEAGALRRPTARALRRPRSRARDVPSPLPQGLPASGLGGRRCRLPLATMFLGLEPDVPDGRVALAPRCRAVLDVLEVRGIRFPGGRLSIDVDRRGPRLLSVPAGCVVELRPLTPPAGGEPA